MNKLGNLGNEESKIVFLDEDIDKIFVLKSPPKGKIFKGPNWNAFIKKKFSSIPKNSENILFKDKSKEMKIGFSSQTRRFKNKNETNKYTFPGPGDYKEINLQEKGLKNPSFSNKGYGGFLSTTDRFDILRKFNEINLDNCNKYKKDDIFIENKATNLKMFKSLYNSDELKYMKKLKQSTVNNFYNPLSPINLNINLQKENNSIKENFFLQSKNRQRLPIEYTTLSPGSDIYNLYNTNTFNSRKIYNKTSCFFNDKSEKGIDINDILHLNKKYPIKKNIIGSLGQTDILSDLEKLKQETNNKKIIFDKDREKEILKEKKLEEINLLKGIRREAFLPFLSPFNKLKNSARDVFLSKSQNENF
jgi:hypothetical protein